MTYTITLNATDSINTAAVREIAERAVERNPALSGATVEVEPGDYTSVDGPDEIVGAQLLSDVCSLLDEC